MEEKKENILAHNLGRIGIHEHEYRAKFYLSEEEREWARRLMEKFPKPAIAICTRSKEPVKNWLYENWSKLLQELCTKFTIIHLGDDQEPEFDGVIRFAGKHTMRESAAILSHCSLFVGPDSLLMHVANGLNIKSVIIFGGSRPVECFGYSENINLSTKPECSPCWIHKGYETCGEDYHCLRSISVSQVVSNIQN